MTIFSRSSKEALRTIGVVGGKVRYRATQINMVKIDGAISAHATVKTEYLLTLERPKDSRRATVELEDSVYNFHTKGTEAAAALVRATDRIKRRLVYELDSKGVPVGLLNIAEVQENWRAFKETMTREGCPEGMDEKMSERFVTAGDIEYNSEEIILKNSNVTLFNKVVFGQYLTRDEQDFEVEIFHTQSQIFPQITFDVHCLTENQGESNGTVHFCKKGEPLFVDKSAMMALYEKMYRERIGYKFTDYIYEFTARFSIQKDINLIQKAEIRIAERIKNNVEYEVAYELRAVEL